MAKQLIIADDEEVQSEEMNPFSFREFLRWKNQDQDQEETYRKVGSSLTFDPEHSSCFFPEPSLCQQEGEEAWGRSFLPGEEEETRFSSRPEDQLTEDQLTGDNYEGDDETSITEPISSRRRKSLLQQLQEENVSLRSSLVEQQQRVEALSEELQQRRRQEEKEAQQRRRQEEKEAQKRRRQEEKEAQDLESMVHSVEQNLGLMTKRAVRAESSVSKLKLELQKLQAQVDSLQKENDSLKSADSQVVMTMRQNAQMASEYLTKTLTLAHSSIRQLLGETETLHLVSQLLLSIDKMSELNTEP
ncbi:endosome-associated-trafficking regulator 1 isoform X6 [Scomber japonicus]|uniref:endosome-associated-trafficking regulator 1 isoform X6 n=1 Tax=Scomber japonicus TaxID=13676 RepID=UPI002305D81F|nr:endosome-associated-trafficking regulator 1 isoform X6 [Scomber japonicus]